METAVVQLWMKETAVVQLWLKETAVMQLWSGFEHGLKNGFLPAESTRKTNTTQTLAQLTQ